MLKSRKKISVNRYIGRSLIFYKPLASPTKRFSFALEYESPMSECHDSVHLEEKTEMPKTSAVREHFKLSEDKTKAGAWWKQNSDRDPKLAFAAKHLLYVPATSTPSERIFSTAGYVVNKTPSSFLPENVDKQIFLTHNMKRVSGRLGR